MSEAFDLSKLKKSSVRGGAITLVSQAASVILQLASTIILARMLTPDDYGVMGMVLSFVALAALFKDLGLSSAAIQKESLTFAQQSNLLWVNALFGLALTLLFAAAAPLVAWFFGRPELLGMTWVLSITFFLTGISAQHNAMMVRKLHFGRQAIVNVASISTTFVTSFLLAGLGYGYWALGWGYVAGAIARTGLTWTLSPFHPSGWKRGVGTMEMIRFGANVTGFNFANYFSRNLDNVLIGKFFGADALGVYGRAYQLMLFPVQNLLGPMNAVTYPALSRLQQNEQKWKSYHLKSIKVLASMTMPFAAWAYLIATPLVLIALGSQWREVATIFQILALVAFIQPCLSALGMVLLSRGKSRIYFRLGVFNAAIYSIGFLLGSLWGVHGVAYSFVITTYLILFPSLKVAYWGTEVRVLNFFEATAFPALASVGAVLFTFALSALPTLTPILTGGGWPELIGRTASVAMFGLATVCLTKSGRATWREFRTLFLELSRSRS
ncbi:lipopolysaccharide biosynthesis protein [Henriciella sp.]|uniref:lipopolysaccharide biosynthesis protein n=1 Tax=Henriciella sp. TaxID=1968823 RepID=UPI00180F86DD|nr:lipopolysaccharide biosynthesis protein [Henriciella sp.]HIG23041.1 lipopolysaccharide biosynthesis protein [Henriciella sp.]